jgi:hypothetical protein
VNLPNSLDHLRDRLGQAGFDARVATGKAMEPANAVRYARDQIQLARREAGEKS